MSASVIHPTAIIDPSATIGDGCEIGPYCIIGPNVTLGANCWLQHHVTLCGPSTIGSGNRFFAYTSIGQQSQDLKYSAEPTYLEVGNDNTFREFVTVHRATSPGDKTVVGSHGNFLSYAHVAHDCIVGDHVIFSNNGTLAGHVIMEDHAIIGGLAACHQFCRIGRHSISGGCTKIVKDIPPFVVADGVPAVARAINKVGLERNGFTAAQISAIEEAFRLLYRSNLNTSQALECIETDLAHSPEAQEMVGFVRESKRGIIRGATK